MVCEVRIITSWNKWLNWLKNKADNWELRNCEFKMWKLDLHKHVSVNKTFLERLTDEHMPMRLVYSASAWKHGRKDLMNLKPTVVADGGSQLSGTSSWEIMSPPVTCTDDSSDESSWGTLDARRSSLCCVGVSLGAKLLASFDKKRQSYEPATQSGGCTEGCSPIKITLYNLALGWKNPFLFTFFFLGGGGE